MYCSICGDHLLTVGTMSYHKGQCLCDECYLHDECYKKGQLGCNVCHGNICQISPVYLLNQLDQLNQKSVRTSYLPNNQNSMYAVSNVFSTMGNTNK